MVVFFTRLLTSLSLEINLTLEYDECEIWVNKHVYFAKEIHFYNTTVAFVKIDTLNDLNVTTQCSPRGYNIQNLKIFANKNILFDNDLDLTGVINIFNSSKYYNDVWLQNVDGFNKNNRELSVEKEAALFRLYDITVFEITNVIFDFYQQDILLGDDKCKRENFDSKTNFFGQLKGLLLTFNVFFNNKICPYVFLNTKLVRLDLYEISDSLLFMNRLEFLNINETTNFNINNKLVYINFYVYNGQISLVNLNPFAFKPLKYLVIKGNLEGFDEDLFENFKEISFISVKSDDLVNFFHRGTKWLNPINKNLNVSLNSQFDFRRNIHRLVSVEFAVQSFLFYNIFYLFPDDDICLFKNFPHSQLVLPLMVFDAIKFNPNKFSCTLACRRTINSISNGISSRKV
jgi:hypothetical protein